MTAYDIIAQIIGFIGLALSALSFQGKKHSTVMIFRTASEICFGAQYIMLGAYSGAAITLIGPARNAVFMLLIKKGRPTLPAQIAFSVIFTAAGILTWQGPVTLLVIAAKILTTVAYGMKDTGKLRLITLPSNVCWLIYNAVFGSYGGMASEALNIVSIAIALIRIDLKAHRERKRAENKSAEDRNGADRSP